VKYIISFNDPFLQSKHIEKGNNGICVLDSYIELMELMISLIASLLYKQLGMEGDDMYICFLWISTIAHWGI
jgi:hypothetical protein